MAFITDDGGQDSMSVMLSQNSLWPPVLCSEIVDRTEIDCEIGSIQSSLSSETIDDIINEKKTANKKRCQTTSVRKSARSKVYTCDYCKEKFHDADVYKDHKWIHAGLHPIPCSYCKEIFKCKEIYKSHVESSHRSSCLDKICATCRKLFLSRRELETHIRETHASADMKCEICGQIFPSIKLLSMHIAVHHEKDTHSPATVVTRRRTRSQTEMANSTEMPIQTNRKKGRGNTGLNVSSSSPPRTQRNSKAEFVKKEPEQKGALVVTLSKKHKVKSHHENHFLCEFCSNSYKYGQDLKNHMWTHADIRPIACRLCSMEMFSKEMYRCHLLDSHFDESRDKYCETCNKMFICVKDLTLHIKTSGHPKPTLKAISMATSPHTSSATNRPKRKSVVKHEEGEKPYCCPVCGKIFERRDHLNRHQVVHTGDKPFACPLCNEKFSRKDGLKRHMDYKHGDTQRLECEICNKKFSRSDKLKLHMQNMHKKTGLKNTKQVTAQQSVKVTQLSKSKQNFSKKKTQMTTDSNVETLLNSKCNRRKASVSAKSESSSIPKKRKHNFDELLFNNDMTSPSTTYVAESFDVELKDLPQTIKQETVISANVSDNLRDALDKPNADVTVEPRAIKMHPKMRAKKAMIQFSESYSPFEFSRDEGTVQASIQAQFGSTDQQSKMDDVKLENGSHLISSLNFSTFPKSHVDTLSFPQTLEPRDDTDPNVIKSIFGILPSDETLADSLQMASAESILPTIPTTTIESILCSHQPGSLAGSSAGISPPRSVIAPITAGTTTTDVTTDIGSNIPKFRTLPSSDKPAHGSELPPGGRSMTLPLLAMHDPGVMTHIKPAESWSDSLSDDGSDLNDTLQNIVQQLEADDST